VSILIGVQAGQVELILRGKAFQRHVLEVEKILDFFDKFSC
jgi:hypothetical protein